MEGRYGKISRDANRKAVYDERASSESGCLLLHLDWHVAHYVKVIMDQIFGEEIS